MSGRVLVLLGLVLLLSLLGTAPILAQDCQDAHTCQDSQDSTVPQPVTTALHAHCRTRMQTLRARAQQQQAQMEWRRTAAGEVQGHYISYSPSHTCTARRTARDTLIGTLEYWALHYTLAGPTIAAARAGETEPDHAEKITEMFLYRDGQWK